MGLCSLLNLGFLFSLHSRIPTNEGLPQLVVEYFVRTWSRLCAPDSVHRICCFFTMRLLTT
jgi:hypothetical protein